MSKLKQNIVANVVGQGWTVLLGLAIVPLYIRFLGIEAYGLIAFYMTLQYILNNLLDFGATPTINRELARYSARPELAGEARDFVRTLEVGYWAISVVIGIAVVAVAPWIATDWIRSEKIDIATVQRAVVIMGAVSAIQWPISLYQGGLFGLQKQVLLNGLNVSVSTVRNVGAVLVLWLVSPTIMVFFYWQIIINAAQLVLMTVVLWRNLPRSDHAPRLAPRLLVRTWRFAAGMAGTSLLACILRQMDKVVLSKLLTLEMFGYYALASIAGRALGFLSGPILNALLPRLSALVALDDHEALKALYHQACQLVAVITLPAAAVGALFAYELLWLWTGSQMTAEITAPIVTLLIAGTALNSLIGVSYDLQVAYGWTKLGFVQTLVGVIVLAPAMIVLTTRYGAIGAAAVWVMYNAGGLLIAVPVMHSRLLRGELRRWYLEDVGRPLAVALCVAGAGRWLMPAGISRVEILLVLAIVSAATLVACGVSLPHVRTWVGGQFSRLRVVYEA